jgi:hypothetical protein
MGLEREPGTELSGESATRLARHSGNWLLGHGTRKALTTNVMTGEDGKRRAPLAGPEQF